MTLLKGYTNSFFGKHTVLYTNEGLCIPYQTGFNEMSD
jgi:hypothetical protein